MKTPISLVIPGRDTYAMRDQAGDSGLSIAEIGLYIRVPRIIKSLNGVVRTTCYQVRAVEA